MFDGHVAHISTWLYQAEALLDEIETKPASKQEEIVKVVSLTSPTGRSAVLCSLVHCVVSAVCAVLEQFAFQHLLWWEKPRWPVVFL